MSEVNAILASEREALESKETQLLEAIEQDLAILQSKISKLTGPETSLPQQLGTVNSITRIIINPRSSILELDDFRREKAAFLAKVNKAVVHCSFVKDLVRDKGQLLDENLRLDAENMGLKRKLLRIKQEYTSLRNIILPKRLQDPKITELEVLMLKFANESFTNQQKEHVLDLQVKILQKEEELQRVREQHKREKEELIKQRDGAKKHLVSLVGDKTSSDGVMRKLIMELIKTSNEKTNEKTDEQTPEKSETKTRRRRRRSSQKAQAMKSPSSEADSPESEFKKPRRRRKVNIDMNETGEDEEETVQKRSSKRSLAEEFSEKAEGKSQKKSTTKKMIKTSNNSMDYFLTQS